MVLAKTAKAHGPRQVGVGCYGPCTAASCAGMFKEYIQLAFIYSIMAYSVTFQIRAKRLS